MNKQEYNEPNLSRKSLLIQPLYTEHLSIMNTKIGPQEVQFRQVSLYMSITTSYYKYHARGNILINANHTQAITIIHIYIYI
jgi:hypothetical protein